MKEAAFIYKLGVPVLKGLILVQYFNIQYSGFRDFNIEYWNIESNISQKKANFNSKFIRWALLSNYLQ